MGCQREIAAKIVEKESDSLLAVKGNQRKLLQAAREVIAEASASKWGFSLFCTPDILTGFVPFPSRHP
jgi:predicted transposase YbfD/YdcC